MPDGNDSNGIHPNVEHGVLDFVGVGFGPSNLALAIAVKEHNDDPEVTRPIVAEFVEV